MRYLVLVGLIVISISSLKSQEKIIKVRAYTVRIVESGKGDILKDVDYLVVMAGARLTIYSNIIQEFDSYKDEKSKINVDGRELIIVTNECIDHNGDKCKTVVYYEIEDNYPSMLSVTYSNVKFLYDLRKI